MYLLNVAHWQNGSALASIAALLIEKLESEQWDSDYATLPAYQLLLEKFRKIYSIDKLSWETLHTYLSGYAHPHDQQSLWIMPLLSLFQQSKSNIPQHPSEITIN